VKRFSCFISVLYQFNFSFISIVQALLQCRNIVYLNTAALAATDRLTSLSPVANDTLLLFPTIFDGVFPQKDIYDLFRARFAAVFLWCGDNSYLSYSLWRVICAAFWNQEEVTCS